MPQYVEVAKKSAIPDGGALCVEVAGKKVALFNRGGEIFALDDTCPHEEGPLSDGTVEGEEVICPWHQSRFNLRTGRVTMDPAESNVAAYPVRVTGERVEIEI